MLSDMILQCQGPKFIKHHHLACPRSIFLLHPLPVLDSPADPDTAKAFSGSRFPNKTVDCEVKRRRLKVESIDSDHVEVELLVSGLCTMAAVIPVSLAADRVVGSMVGMGPVQMGVKIIWLVDFLLGAYRVWCFFRCLGRYFWEWSIRRCTD